MRIWLGFHPSIGIVIFDPLRQAGVEKSQVRLWDVGVQAFAFYDRSTVRAKLASLRSHLVASRLEPLISMHRVAAQVAKRYLVNRPQISTVADDRQESESAPMLFADDEERHLLVKELMEDQDAWARSEEDGWFYDD